VSTIAISEDLSKLVVAYNNSNLDIVQPGKVINLAEIKRKNIIGDKTIYDIQIVGNVAYLATGFGIVVYDINRNEIVDTWLIGNTGQQLQVSSTVRHDNFMYAVTAEGVKRASVSADLRDFRNWQNINGSNGLPASGVLKVLRFGTSVLAMTREKIFRQTTGTWSQLYSTTAAINNASVSTNKLMITEQLTTSTGRLVVLQQDGSTEVVIENPHIQRAEDAAFIDNRYWIADRFSGLLRVNGNSVERIIPNSPFERASGEMRFHKNRLYVAAGEVNNAWNYTYNRFGLYKFENNSWSFINQYNFPQLDTAYDVITVAGDPRNDDVYYGSYSGGLVRYSNNSNSISIFKQNSPIGPAIGDPTSYRVSGLAFDRSNNLWISNYGAVNNIILRKADNTWKAFTTPFTISENAVSQISIDEANNKWIIAPKGNGLISFNHGSDIDNTADDKWRLFRAGSGNGSLPDNEIFCSVVDKNGLLWIGTAKGAAIVPCTDDPFNTNCRAVQPVVQQGNFAGPLFGTQEVRTIAVDGANRKWIGTKTGLWLVSADGDKVLDHFNEDNSPLLSNEILRIAIDPQSGEVFVSTTKGICSYRGAATEPTSSKNHVLVFPNPVPANFTGTIAIKGLPENSSVKITELNGRLVFETTSLGGQAVWNGRDYRGRKISSSAYLVFIRSTDGKEKLATKIFVAR
jgi:ligand-binding sensor domain-containing protein